MMVTIPVIIGILVTIGILALVTTGTLALVTIGILARAKVKAKEVAEERNAQKNRVPLLIPQHIHLLRNRHSSRIQMELLVASHTPLARLVTSMMVQWWKIPSTLTTPWK